MRTSLSVTACEISPGSQGHTHAVCAMLWIGDLLKGVLSLMSLAWATQTDAINRNPPDIHLLVNLYKSVVSSLHLLLIKFNYKSLHV